MCRYDDDYDWLVTETDTAAVNTTPEQCEDCCRMIPAGEVHVRYTGESCDGERWVFGAQRPEHAGFSPARILPSGNGLTEQRWVRESNPWWEINEDDEALWEALGFVVGECEVPGVESLHAQCAQCHAANAWLIKVCSQQTVLCTVEDLSSHRYEYEPHQLGRAFVRLHNLCRRRWRVRNDGGTVDVAAVEALTAAAIEYALSPAGIGGD
jgi:hypothetical protein